MTDEAIKQEYWRIRNMSGRPVSIETWTKKHDRKYPGHTKISKKYGSWNNFRKACGDIEFMLTTISHEPKNIPCNYDGIMIHYTKTEYARLQNIKDLKHVETKNI